MLAGGGSSYWYIRSAFWQPRRLTPPQEGLATILIAALAYLFISNYPETVSWLSKEERSYINARLKADSDATHDEKFTWGSVLNAAKDPKVWLYGACFHTMSLPLYTLSLFLVSVILE